MIMIISPLSDDQETFGDQAPIAFVEPAWNPANDLSTKHRNHCQRKSDQRETSGGESTNESAWITCGRRARPIGGRAAAGTI